MTSLVSGWEVSVILASAAETMPLSCHSGWHGRARIVTYLLESQTSICSCHAVFSSRQLVQQAGQSYPVVQASTCSSGRMFSPSTSLKMKRGRQPTTGVGVPRHCYYQRHPLLFLCLAVDEAIALQVQKNYLEQFHTTVVVSLLMLFLFLFLVILLLAFVIVFHIGEIKQVWYTGK